MIRKDNLPNAKCSGLHEVSSRHQSASVAAIYIPIWIGGVSPDQLLHVTPFADVSG